MPHSRHKPATVEAAREALREKLRAESDGSGPSHRTYRERHSDRGGREWGTTVDGLRSKTRTKALTVPRQIAMYLTRDLLGMQLVEIGNAFGGRDHSTVIHSLDKVNQMMEADPQAQTRIASIRSVLASMRI